jgi:cytochrome c553
MRKFKGFFLFLSVLVFVGCSSNEKKEETGGVQQEVSKDKIKISKGEKRVVNEKSLHKKEIEKDTKDFYYSLKEKGTNTDTTEETYTRVDAQKRVKNKVIDGKVAIITQKKDIENPYDYVRIDLLKRALSKDFIVKCSACHDNYANGIIGPSLLRRDAKFIYETLIKYRNKPDANVLMRDLVNNMSKDELKKMAEEIAIFNKEVREIRGEK